MMRTAVFFMLLIFLTGTALKGVGSSAPEKSARPSRVTNSAKLIALTFDDGPKPYVLMGLKSGSGIPSGSLLDLLDHEHIHATFFVMGWRLSKNADKFCTKIDGAPCR